MKHFFGIMGVVTAPFNPLMSVGWLTLCGIAYWQDHKVRRAGRDTMTALIRANHEGLRHLVGNEEMDRAIQLVGQDKE